MLARHKFECAVHAKVQQCVGFEAVLEPQIEGREGMRGRETCFKQKSHRVTFVTEGGLQADEHITILSAQYEYAASIGLDAAGGGPPNIFDFVKPWGA